MILKFFESSPSFESFGFHHMGFIILEPLTPRPLNSQDDHNFSILFFCEEIS